MGGKEGEMPVKCPALGHCRMLEQFVKNCIPWVGPHAGAGEKHEEEEVAEARCDELAATPIPCSCVLLGARRWRMQE